MFINPALTDNEIVAVIEREKNALEKIAINQHERDKAEAKRNFELSLMRDKITREFERAKANDDYELQKITSIRERPGGIYKVTRVLPKKEKLIILTPVKGINETLWYKVRGSNFIGYVSSQDIRLVPWSYPGKIQLVEKYLYLVIIGSLLALILIIFIRLNRLNKLQNRIP